MTLPATPHDSLLPLLEPERLVLIGAGNVAWHLGQAVVQYRAKYTQIEQVYSRNLSHAQELADKLNGATATNSLDFSSSAADLFLIAVPDAALEQVINAAIFPENAVVAHTSGNQPLNILSRKVGDRAGVFYPLQTFSKDVPMNMKEVPILLEGNKRVLRMLRHLGSALSSRVTEVDSQQRKQLHLAAVFACNFTNHLIGVSRELLQHAGLDHTLLHPLLNQTIAKAEQYHPFAVQTGPAVRGDQNVLANHLFMLRQLPAWQEIYDVLSRSIEQTAQAPVVPADGLSQNKG